LSRARRAADPAEIKAALEAFCRALPGATEDVKWGDHRVFCVGDKMFAVFNVGDAEPVTLKVDAAVFPILTREPGITPAPYLARASWVRLESPRVLPRDEIEALLRESHELVAAKLPKRLRRELGITT
jgi:predicted DNA-binding protein (MmcQ/YjbR family)